MGVDLTASRGRCTKRFAMIAKRNAKSLSSPAETVRFTVRIVSPSAKIAVVKKEIKGMVLLFKKENHPFCSI